MIFSNSFLLIKREKSSILIFLLSSLLTMAMFLIINNFSNALAIYNFKELTTSARWDLVYLTLTDTTFLDTTTSVLIFTASSILLGVNISLLMRHYKKRVGMARSGLTNSVMGFVLIFFGFGCGLCGGLFILTISAFSISASSLLLNTNILGYIGLSFLLFSSYKLLKLNLTKNVC